MALFWVEKLEDVLLEPQKLKDQSDKTGSGREERGREGE